MYVRHLSSFLISGHEENKTLPRVRFNTHWSVGNLTNFVTRLSLATYSVRRFRSAPRCVWASGVQKGMMGTHGPVVTSHFPLRSALLQLKKTTLFPEDLSFGTVRDDIETVLWQQYHGIDNPVMSLTLATHLTTFSSDFKAPRVGIKSFKSLFGGHQTQSGLFQGSLFLVVVLQSNQRHLISSKVFSLSLKLAVARRDIVFRCERLSQFFLCFIKVSLCTVGIIKITWNFFDTQGKSSAALFCADGSQLLQVERHQSKRFINCGGTWVILPVVHSCFEDVDELLVAGELGRDNGEDVPVVFLHDVQHQQGLLLDRGTELEERGLHILIKERWWREGGRDKGEEMKDKRWER